MTTPSQQLIDAANAYSAHNSGPGLDHEWYPADPTKAFIAGAQWAEAEIAQLREALEAVVKAAYRERNAIAVALSRLFPSWIGVDTDEPDWPVLYVELPTGQVSWHFSPDDADLLSGASVGGTPWDGHTTDEKYARLAALAAGAAEEVQG